MTVRGSITTRRRRDGTLVHCPRAWINGERVRLGSFEDLDDAEEALRTAQEDHADAGGAISLGAWGAKWLDLRETDGQHRAAANDRSRWDRHVATSKLAGLALRRVTRGDVVRWLDGMLRKPGRDGRLSRQTVVHALHLVQRSLTDALNRGLISTHPALRIEVPKEARTDEPWTWLEQGEIAKLLALPARGKRRPSSSRPALSDEQRAAITVAIYSGLRAGELWGLRWRDVILDGPRPELVVAHSYRGPTKSGRVRRVPLLDPAREALRAWRTVAPGVADALVFPAEHGGPRSPGYQLGWWGRVLRYAQVRSVRWHDLRHTCASHLVQGTWTPRPLSLFEVRAWLGHESQATTERYAHLAPGGLHDALGRGPAVVPANRRKR